MLGSKKRQELRSQAQQLRAKVQIGHNGLTDAVINNIKEMFNTTELIKIKVNREDNSDKTIVKEYANTISKETKCEIVYIIGTSIIVYKYNDKLHKKEVKRKSRR